MKTMRISAETEVLVSEWIRLGYSAEEVKASLERHVRSKIMKAQRAVQEQGYA